MASFAPRLILCVLALSRLAFSVPAADPNLVERTVGPPACDPETKLVGDGSPHQNYLHKQVTQPETCSQNQTCSVSHLTSYTIGWTSTLGLAQWFSGSFAVSESYTTGDSYTCNGNAGDTVCVWAKVAHTAYTAQEVYGSCKNPSDPFIIKSPNKDNRGGEYYCVVGTCRNDGDEYWDDTGRSGGP